MKTIEGFRPFPTYFLRLEYEDWTRFQGVKMHRHSRNYRCRLRGKCDGTEPLDPALTNKNMRNTSCSISQTWCWVQTLRWTIAVMLCTRRFNQRNFYMVRLVWDWEVIEFLFAKNPEDSTLLRFSGLPQVQSAKLLLQTWPQGQEFAENVPPPLSIDLEEPAKMGSFMERSAAAALVERETIFHFSGMY